MTIKIFFNKVLRRLRHLYVDFERFFSLTWFNPLATLYINLRLLPISKAFILPIFVYGRPRFFSLYGKAIFDVDRVYPGIVRLNRRRHVAGSPNNTGGPSEFNIYGTMVFKGRCQIGTDNKICVGERGFLTLGKDVLIMSACNITAYKEVRIGDNAIISHRSQIMDTNYHYVANFIKKRVKPIATPIILGNNCWICNSATIMGGAKLPDYVIVANGSMVNKDLREVAKESVIGGCPAKVITEGCRFVYNSNFSREISCFFNEHPESESYIIEDNTSHDICDPI